jgi:hypothetical protein
VLVGSAYQVYYAADFAIRLGNGLLLLVEVKPWSMFLRMLLNPALCKALDLPESVIDMQPEQGAPFYMGRAPLGDLAAVPTTTSW